MLQRLFGTSPARAEVAPTEASQRQSQGALVLDVREEHEWAGGHVPGARHIPLATLARQLDTLPTDCELLCICRSGGRSAQAVEALQRAGFRRAVNISGGMLAWSQAGLPTTR